MIQFINVTKEYRNGTVGLKDINVKIEDGEFVFLIGASGAGKSTFTKLMIREIAPTSGSILIDGKGIHRLKKREIPIFRRNMGFVFQNYRLLSDRTAFENVAFAMEALGYGRDEVKKRAMYTLGQMGLANRAQHFPAELSGGEQQRVAIARAIVNNPKILVADEPTGNLDFETSREIMDILYEINESGTTVLMATHDRGIVEKSHHRILTLANGRLVGDDNLLAGYAIGHSNVQRSTSVLLDAAEQEKNDRGFHAATDEIGRVKSRLSMADAVQTEKKNYERNVAADAKTMSADRREMDKKILLHETKTLGAEAGKTAEPMLAQAKAAQPAKTIEETQNLRSEQIKAVLEKSNNLKREEKALLEKKEETVEHTALLEKNYKQEQQTKDAANIASEAKSQNDDWEKLILEAFK